MNLQLSPPLPSIRVLIVNPLCSCSRLIIMKILRGYVFGESTRIDLILLVYSNEQPDADSLKAELLSCAFLCLNSITVTLELPRYTDADVFCFVTNFINPNSYSTYKADGCDEQFDMLYLLLKLANHWSKYPLNSDGETKDNKPNVKCMDIKTNTIPKRAVIMTDGLITLHILKSISKVLPSDVLFCPTPLCTVAKHVLADYLKVGCPDVNEMCIWAADDQVFHIVIEEPVIVRAVQRGSITEGGAGEPGDSLLKDQIQRLNLDYTQFNESWMKTHFVNKVLTMASKNTYGNVSRAAEFCKTLNTIWKGLTMDPMENKEIRTNLGIISDGSFDSAKGQPYVFPVIFRENKWQVDQRKKNCPHLRLEMKRINKVLTNNHSTLLSYCKEFLEHNVINQQFVAMDQESSTLESSDTCEQMRL